jgi:hypothetical protein
MTIYASSQRAPSPDSTDTLEDAIAALGRRGTAAADLMPVLVRYWQETPHRSAIARRGLADRIRARLHAGELTSRALVPVVLGDPDVGIVTDSVIEYLGTHPVSIERRQAAIDECIDWIRRGLALNRAAVFAALLSVGDAVINDGIGRLRLTLSHAEIAAICARCAATSSRATRQFLVDWLQLLDACEHPDPAARSLVAATLEVLLA